MVLVQIPQNNFNNQKTILGRVEDLEAQSKAYNFSFPFDKFVPLKQLSNALPAIDMHYHANDPADGNSLLYDKEYFNNAYLNHNLVYAFENTGETALFGSTLGIKVDVQTLLHGYDAQEGDYGFQILVKGIRKDVDGETTKGATDVYYFTNDNMYGNPYNYILPMEQQILLDVSPYMTIEAIYVVFWQDFTKDENGVYNGSFKDSWGELIPYVDDTLEGTGLSEIPPNLIFENLEVYLGITTDEVDKDTLFIYTYDDMKYGKDTNLPGERSYYDKKSIYLTWVRLSDDLKSTTAIDTTEKLKEHKARVYWYQHDPEWHPDNEEYDENIDSHRFGGLYWKPLMHFEDAMNIEVIPDINKSRARYKAVVHYDGNYITSDIITFNNAVDVEGLAEDLARNDKYILRISTFKEDPNNKGQYTLVPDDSLGNFFVYDENNNVLANDDAIPFSKVEYYLEVWVKSSVDENGKAIYTRLSDFTEMVEQDGVEEEIFAPFIIDWKFPENYNMLASFEEIQREDAYFSQRTDEQFERDKITTRKFKIKSIYNMRYSDNDINAILERNGQTFTLTKQLLFGQAASFGCEFTPIINITNPAGNFYVATGTSYTLECLVYDRRCMLFESDKRADCKFTWKICTANGEQSYTAVGNSNGFVGNTVTGTTTVPMVAEVTVTGAADYPITVRRGIMICNSPAFMQQYDILCPDRVEFRSDGQNPKYYTGNFVVQTLSLDEDGRYIYPNWTISQSKHLALKHTTVPAQTITQPDGETVSYDEHIETKLVMGNVRNTNQITNNYAYAQQWTDSLLESHNFTSIGFTYEGATVQQAIAFSQNSYASSLVNEWDGQSLSLDYENSAVIGKMFAAGTKDSRNRFTGIMMGDWSSKADESLDNPGIYGFKAGLQTFGFKQDGTGFIGPSGRGRIQFDGRNALISNSDRSCYINLNPIKVLSYWDEEKKVFIKDNIPDLLNESGFSQYFLYCKVPRAVDASDIENLAEFSEEDTSYIDKTWAKKFIDPKETDANYGYDFFLVDPSLGVVTSGGVYARYGVIGQKYPWIISDSGLTQKNNFGIIYLGNPEQNPTKWPKAVEGLNQEGEWAEVGFSISGSHKKSPSSATFGVTNDGQLYARKGHLGLRYPWHIGDDGLYSEIGSNAVYIGNPRIAYSYHKISDTYGNTRKWKEKTNNGFIISAGGISEKDAETGEVIAETKSPAVFGVRPDGFMYSENGLIAGWSIEPDSLTKYATTDDGEVDERNYLIRLDSKKAQIAMVSDAEDPPLILLDALNKTVKIGGLQDEALIKLAGYQIIGDTKGTTSAQINAQTGTYSSVDQTQVDIVQYETSAESDGGNKETITKTVHLTSNDSATTIFNELSINMNSPNRFIINDDINDRGFAIYTDNSDTLIAGTRGAHNHLGSSNSLWNVFSDVVSANDMIVNNNFVGQNVYVKDEFKNYDGAGDVAGYFRVSSRAYVNYRIKEIADMITALNQAVYDAFNWTRTRVNIMWSALGGKTNEIKANLEKLKDAVVSIESATFEGSGGSMEADVKYSTIGGTGQSSFKLNFDIAATQFFKDSRIVKSVIPVVGNVAIMVHTNTGDTMYVDISDVYNDIYDEAYKKGWAAAAGKVSASYDGFERLIVQAPGTEVDSTVQGYGTYYESQYTEAQHSYSPSSHTFYQASASINGSTYQNSSFSGQANGYASYSPASYYYKESSHSYTPAIYSESQFSWTGFS